MALTFLEELEKCGDEVETVKVVVPDGQEVYNKITKGRSESRITQEKRKVSINHTETTILRQKVAKLKKKVADQKKELEMQKKDRTQDPNLSSDKTLSRQELIRQYLFLQDPNIDSTEQEILGGTLTTAVLPMMDQSVAWILPIFAEHLHDIFPKLRDKYRQH